MRLTRKSVISSIVVLSLLIPLALTGCGTPTKELYSETKKTARDLLWKDINSGNANSASIAIMDNGKIVYSEGFGMADREKSILVDKNTVYNIGSISKVFCATAVLLLVDEGKVSLDTPVTKYVKDFIMADERYKDVTVRMLLNHSSGIPGTAYSDLVNYESNRDAYKNLLTNLSRAHLSFKPGEMSVYCDDGFSLADLVVERVTGKKIQQYLQEKVFTPLSLKSTGTSVGTQDNNKPTAANYKIDTGEKNPFEIVDAIGAGGIASTSEDLCRFAYSISGGGKQILSEASRKELSKLQPSSITGELNSPDGLPYSMFGLGIDTVGVPMFKAQGINVLQKSGSTNHYNSNFLFLPEQKIAVAGLVSGAHSNIYKITTDILNQLLIEKGLMKQTGSSVEKPLEEGSAMPKDYKSYEGFYSSEAGIIRIAVDTDKNAMPIYKVDGSQEVLLGTSIFKDGYMISPVTGSKSYLKEINGTKYIVVYSGVFADGIVSFEKVEAPKIPQKLKVDIDQKIWLRRNVKPFELLDQTTIAAVKSSEIKALPGYISFDNVLEVKSPDYASIPTKSIRDQRELSLVNEGNEVWARLYEMLFSPESSARVLKAGEITASIGDNNYSEWLRTDDDLILSFEKSEKGRVFALTPDLEFMYDSVYGKNEVYLPEGSYIGLAGIKGDTFKIKAK